MWYTYILESEFNEKYYIGYTGDLNDRINWHNAGKSKWTKKFKPWKLVYSEKFENKTDAIVREKKLKSFKNKKYLKEIIESSGFVV